MKCSACGRKITRFANGWQHEDGNYRHIARPATPPTVDDEIEMGIGRLVQITGLSRPAVIKRAEELMLETEDRVRKILDSKEDGETS